VSLGLKEVSMEAIDEAGEVAERNFDRKRLLYLRGMGFGIEGHENCILVFE
jgi:hypothetical protein